MNGMYLAIIKARCDKNHAQWQKLKNISAKIKNKTKMSTFTTFIQHSTEFPSQSSYAIKNRKKMLPHWNRSKTASACIWYMWKNLYVYVWVHSKSLQARLTLCDPMDHGPPGSSVRGILQERIQKWVAMPSSRGSQGLGVKSASLKSPAVAGSAT